MNRVVYDCVDAAPTQQQNNDENAEIEPQTKVGADEVGAEDPNQCDNDQILTPYY